MEESISKAIPLTEPGQTLPYSIVFVYAASVWCLRMFVGIVHSRFNNQYRSQKNAKYQKMRM